MWRYAAPFLFLGSIPVLRLWSPIAPLLTIAALLTALIGAELSTSAREVAPSTPSTRFRWLPLAYVCAQIAVTAWAILDASSLSSAPLAFTALVFTVGVVSGVFGMLAAHELVHSHDAKERIAGTVMLIAMMYGQFRVSHIYGHHRWAATTRDSSTAWRGESFYAFLVRTVRAQYRDAWRFEQRRIKRRGGAWLGNRVYVDLIITAGFSALIFAWCGFSGLIFFALQSAIAIIVLELFNYIAHYGLMRRDRGAGLEPLGDHHSWNSSNALANMIIFNMGRHSDHHRHPARSYERLSPVVGAPELPAGYAGSILLALVPPLWRRLMDARLDRLSDKAECARCDRRSPSPA